MVYISHPTELGTLYTASELTQLSSLCHEYNIPLYIDGARLAYGLMAETDVDLPLISKLADLFYIGGTKVGTLNGEALVFTKKNAPANFYTIIKQHGAMLAKGRLTGIQFDTLFTDGLYEKIGEPAIKAADKIRTILQMKDYHLCFDSPTNQIFCVMENDQLEKFGERVEYSFWEKYDGDNTVIRLATDWATTPEETDALIEIL